MIHLCPPFIHEITQNHSNLKPGFVKFTDFNSYPKKNLLYIEKAVFPKIERFFVGFGQPDDFMLALICFNSNYMAEKCPSISVIIPCFNEGKRIYGNIEKIHGWLSENFTDFEIIAVDDGSLDHTASELERAGKSFDIRFITHQTNFGKGRSVRTGMSAVRPESDIIMFLDADLAIPIESLRKFIPEVERGHDLVIASRFVPGLRVLKPVP
jgi:cellulose synthase/poly-beta-1,6-N-acetylglucosamine synthase-like glycosyltransferase